MTRNGKIARLPEEIRTQLNTRLSDGEEGATLLDWLNALPQVQASLKENFDGVPISKQNLSEWRQGGFREWEMRQELLGHARQLRETSNEMEEALDIASLPGAMAALLAARYAAVLNAWDGEPDEKIEAKLCLLRRLNQDIALLQKTIQRDVDRKREMEESEAEEYRRDIEEMKQKTLKMMLYAGPEREALAAAIGGKHGPLLAEMITAIKYDLPSPLEKMEKARLEIAKSHPPVPPKSNPVKPSQTESNPGAEDVNPRKS